MAASPDLSLIAPALLRLKENGFCSSPSSGPNESASPSSIPSFANCIECRNECNPEPSCDTCWTECASLCNDDDYNMPSPCFDELCNAPCVDQTCAAEECTDVACPETIHYNATCFDTGCFYDFGGAAFGGSTLDGQECTLGGPCFGFLPMGSSFDNPEAGQDLLTQTPLASEPHQHQKGHWHLGPGFALEHDNVPEHRHKRRKVQSPADLSLDLFGHSLDTDSPAHSWVNPLSPNLASDSRLALDSSYDPMTPQHLRHHPESFVFNDSLNHARPPETFDFEFQAGSPSPLRYGNRSTFGNGAITSCSTLPKMLKDVSLVSSAKKQHLGCNNVDHFCHWVTDGQKCLRHFSDSKDLDDHVQEAHTSKLGPACFTCNWENCNAPFKHRGKLNRHVSGAHSKYHAYRCVHKDATTGEPCGRTFCTKEQLKNHETTHTGERKYKCRFCDHTSATKTQHNTHERIHTREKPYKCPWCGHRSGDSSNLSKHVRNKHPGMAGKKSGVEATAATVAYVQH